MILEALFNGEIYPAEQIIPQSDEYKAECKAVSKLMDELKSTLDGDQYTRIEELHRHMSTTQCMESREQFRYGLSMGLLMMKEAYEHPYLQRED